MNTHYPNHKSAITLGLVVLLVFSQVLAQPAPPATPVVTDTVKATDVVSTLPISGNVYSKNDLQITAGITGQLAFVTEPGTRVAAGDLVARMDTLSLELQKEEQLALISRARAQLQYLETSLRRQKDLVKADTVSANTVEQTESQRDVAASDLRVAELRARQIDDQLQKSEVRAQHDSIVSSRLRREGETISAGTVIGSLTDLSNLEIRVQVPLRYSGYLTPGQELDIYAYGVSQKGAVKSLIPNLDNRNQSYELRVEFPQSDAFSIGQLVTVAIPRHQARESLVVNQDALVLRENGTFVFRVTDDNKVEQVAVQTSENVGEFIAIEGQLAVGDTVVVRGADNLQEGFDVNIQNSSS